MADINARTRLLIGTPADWAAHNLVLGNGELALERSGGILKMKAGDGATAWSGLPYVQAEPVIPSEYLTQTEGDARYLKLADTPGFLTEAEGDARFLRLTDIATASSPNKVPRMDAAGKLPASMLTITTGTYKGAVNATAAVPAGSYFAGDYFTNTTTGLAHPSWGLPGGTNVQAGNQLFYNGAGWEVVAAGANYLPLSGGALTGPLGIGKAPDPGNSLHVWGAAGVTAFFQGAGLGAADAATVSIQQQATGGLLTVYGANHGTRPNSFWLNASTASSLVLGTNNLDRLRIFPDGNVTIGAAAAQSGGDRRLQVGGDNGATSLTTKSGTAFHVTYASQDTDLFEVVGPGSDHIFGRGPIDMSSVTETMRLFSDGNVTIGAPAAQSGGDRRVQIGSTNVATSLTTKSATSFHTTYATANVLEIVGESNAHVFGRGSLDLSTFTENMRIDPLGMVSINGTGNTQFLNVYGNSQATGVPASFNDTRAADGASSQNVVIRRAGAIVGSISTTNTATAFNTSSDYRLKNVEGELQDAAAFIAALRPVYGTWKLDGSPFVGFLAHELAEVCPGAVTGEKDAVDGEGNPIYQGIDPSSPEMIANIVAALKQVQTAIVDIKARIGAPA